MIFNKNRYNRKGQVWVETVVYTLIALTIIAATLAFVKPKLDQAQDKIAITKSIEILNGIDNEIISVWQSGAGNRRNPEFVMNRGSLTIDAVNDLIIFEIPDSKLKFSEPGKKISDGRIEILTESKSGNVYNIMLRINYTQNIDITYDNGNSLKTLSRAPSPYKLSITNKGLENSKTKVDLSIVG